MPFVHFDFMLDRFESLLVFVAFCEPATNLQNRVSISASVLDRLLDSIRTRMRLFADQFVEESQAVFFARGDGVDLPLLKDRRSTAGAEQIGWIDGHRLLRVHFHHSWFLAPYARDPIEIVIPGDGEVAKKA